MNHHAKVLAKKLSEMPAAAGLPVGFFFVATDTAQLFVTVNPTGTVVQWLSLGALGSGTFTMKASNHVDALHAVSFTGDHLVGYGAPGDRAAGVAQNAADSGQDVVVAYSGLLLVMAVGPFAPLTALRLEANGQVGPATPLTVDTANAPSATKPTQGSVVIAQAVGPATAADAPVAVFWGVPSGGLPAVAA